MSDLSKVIYVGPYPPATQGTNLVQQVFRYNEYLQLEGGHKLIRGVVVDNANSNIPVYVWQGRAPNLGTAMIVLPGWSRGFNLIGCSAIFVSMKGNQIGPAQIIGTVYINITTEIVAAFSSISVVTNTTPPNSPDIGPQMVLQDYEI